MKTRLAILSVFIVSFTAIAESITVYRWVDKNDVVHFSQNQPENDNFVELTLAHNSAPAKNGQPTELSLKGNADETQLVNLQQQCETATANLRTLKAFDKIQYTDEKGTTKVLSDLEKTEQLLLNEKQMELYCTNQTNQ
jgi:hypothetical protein